MVLNLMRMQDIRMEDVLRRPLWANAMEEEIPAVAAELVAIEGKLARREPIECVVQDIEDASSFTEHVWTGERCMRTIVKTVGEAEFVARLDMGKVILLAGSECELAAVSETHGNRKITQGTKVRVRTRDEFGVFKESITIVAGGSNVIRDKPIMMRGEQPVPWASVFRKAREPGFVAASDKLAYICRQMMASPCFTCARKRDHVQNAYETITLKSQRDRAREQCKAGADNVMPMMKGYIETLEDLGYIDRGVVTLKGRVAIEMTSRARELLATELLVSDYFGGLAIEEIVALCARLVGERWGRHNSKNVIPTGLEEKLDELNAVTELIATMIDRERIDDRDE